jgi:hypothetical protein
MKLVRVAAVVLLSLGTLTALACETQNSPAPADPNGTPTFCKDDSDCPNGSNCTYPIDVGCSALGECRDLMLTGDTSCCDPGGPVCACNGVTITVPPCWNGLSPVAAQGQGACGTSDAAPDGAEAG